MMDGAGLPDWLLVAGQGLLVALFLVFFFFVIRLWLHLARSGCAYNSAQSPDGAPDGGVEIPSEPGTPLNEKESRT